MAEKSKLDLLISSRLGEGCSEEQIQDLETQFQVTLPDDYRGFLRACGHGEPGLWTGSDYAFGTLAAVQKWASELVAEENVPFPTGTFVILMHQGYQFFCLTPEGVYFYQEGARNFEKRFASFEQFFEVVADS